MDPPVDPPVDKDFCGKMRGVGHKKRVVCHKKMAVIQDSSPQKDGCGPVSGGKSLSL